MVFVQEIDRKRNPYKHTLYGGKGFNPTLPRAYIGGLIDFSSITDFINNNKDLIQTGIAATSKIVDLGKSVSDAVIKTKEVEKIRAEQKNKKKKEVYQFTPEMEEKMKSVKGGGGFAIFSGKK